jgi:hypothetical protein
MSHKDAKPKTNEQLRMEDFYTARLAPQGITLGWGLGKNGEYLAAYARDAWAAWQEAQTVKVIQSIVIESRGSGWVEGAVTLAK